MERKEIISIDGTEVPGHNIQDELERYEISTHYANSIFWVYKERMPLTYDWLIAEGMIEGDEERVLCCLWGT
jgi:hypothetical protein